MRFASPEWIDALATAASATLVPRRDDVSVTVRFEIRAPAAGTVAWCLVLGPDGLRAVHGDDPAAADPDLVVSTDRAHASALAQGTLDAQRAADAGALLVRGDLIGAGRRRDVWEAIGDAFAQVRAETEFD